MKCPLAAGLATAFLVLTLPHSVSAADVPGDATPDNNLRLAKLERQASDARSLAENSWMLTSAALVLMMHISFLRGVGVPPDADYAPTIPAQTFMVYQPMFAIITPALIAGAFAKHMKFSHAAIYGVVVRCRLRSQLEGNVHQPLNQLVG